MAIDTTAMKNLLCDAYKAAALFMSAATALNGAGAAPTEPSGGSPAYARKSISWGTSAAGVVTAPGVVLDIPSGATIVGVGMHSAATAGTYYDKASVTSQAFASQGTYTVTPTYTQT
jgi:hypothetical protein